MGGEPMASDWMSDGCLVWTRGGERGEQRPELEAMTWAALMRPFIEGSGVELA